MLNYDFEAQIRSRSSIKEKPDTPNESSLQ